MNIKMGIFLMLQSILSLVILSSAYLQWPSFVSEKPSEYENVHREDELGLVMQLLQKNYKIE